MPNPFSIADWTSLPALGSRVRKREKTGLTKEEEESLLRSLTSPALSGLAYVGETLDKPGTAVRGTLSGLTGGDWGGGLLNLIPFSDALGITEPKERVYGRDLLEDWGMLSRNRPGLDVGDVAGVAAEIGLDPLSWLSLGTTGALSKAGQVAGKAGLMRQAAKVASKKAGRTVGRMEARMTTTARELIDELGPKANQAFETAAGGRQAASKLLDEKLGGLIGVSPYPVGRAAKVFSPGGLKMAQRLDKWGNKLLYSGPMRGLSSLFDTRVKGATTEVGQTVGRRLSEAERAGKAAVREQMIPEALRMHGLDLGADDIRHLKEAIEEVPGASVRPELDPTVRKVRSLLDEALTEEQKLGMPTPELVDDAVKYLSRQRHVQGIPLPGVRRGSEAWRRSVGAFGKKREDFLRHHPGGTAVLDEMSLDPNLRVGTAKRLDPTTGKYTKKPLDKTALDAIAKRMKQDYGSRLNPNMTPKEGRQLARWLSEMDPRDVSAKIPAFGTDVAGVVTKRLEYSQVGRHTVRGVHDILAEVAESVGDDLPAGMVDLQHALSRAGLTGKKFKGPGDKELFRGREWLLGRLKDVGKDLPDAEELVRWAVPEQHVREVERLMKAFSSPDEIRGLGQAMDNFMNWWRMSVTVPWPAYLTRNLSAGQIQNWIVRGGNPVRILARAKDMDRLMRHGVVPNALDYPIIKQMGITDANQASDTLAQLMARDEVVGPYAGQALETAGPQVSELATEVPGVERFPGVGSTVASGVPRTWAQANPLSVRGVGGLTEDVFGPARGGREMNRYIEGLNRGGLWLDMVKQGVDPTEAARTVRAAHVDYGNLTQFEKLARRGMPFYSFASGMAKFLAGELAARPGGRMAQTIRAASAMRERDPFVPDYLAQTTTIGVPEGFPLIGPKPGGDPRYLGGFGLMHEDPLQFLGGGPGPMGTAKGLLQEVGSRLGPWSKPIEVATGTSLFQAGPRGGRRLESMDPAIGRLLANVSGRDRPVQFPGSQLVEQAAMTAMPRPFTTARTLTDPRKRLGETPLPGPAALTNILTGMRIYDLPQRTQEGILREAVEDKLRGTGVARAFEKTYISKKDLERLPPDERAEAEGLLGLLNLLGKRGGQRKRGEELEPLRTW